MPTDWTRISFFLTTINYVTLRAPPNKSVWGSGASTWQSQGILSTSRWCRRNSIILSPTSWLPLCRRFLRTQAFASSSLSLLLFIFPLWRFRLVSRVPSTSKHHFPICRVCLHTFFHLQCTQSASEKNANTLCSLYASTNSFHFLAPNSHWRALHFINNWSS